MIDPDRFYALAVSASAVAVVALLLAPAWARHREDRQLRRRVAEERARRAAEARDLVLCRRSFPAFRHDPGDQVP